MKNPLISFFLLLLLKLLFRAFKSILKCQRIKQNQSLTNLYQISLPRAHQLRRKEFNSCDVSDSHSIAKLESSTSY